MTTADTAAAAPSWRARSLRILRIAVSLGAFAWLFSTIDVAAVRRTLTSLPFGSLVVAQATVFGSMMIGAARHRALLAAYGATSRPSFLACLRLFLVGYFYNTFLPGSVAGDAVRAVEARESFGAEGTTASLAVVLVERVLGLFGLVVVAGCAFALRPLAGVRGLSTMVMVGVVVAALGVAVVAIARRLGAVFPGALGRLFARLPVLRSAPDFGVAIALSLASQLMVAATGHALITGFDGSVEPLTSLVVVPVAAASAYVPITVSGLGVREAAFARLYALAGVDTSVGAAFSVAFLGVQVLAALVGGALSLVEARRS